MPRVGFEPKVPSSTIAKTFHALDRSTAVAGWTENITEQNCKSIQHIPVFNLALSAQRIMDITLRSKILKLFVRDKM
jgi:hypothetical protein